MHDDNGWNLASRWKGKLYNDDELVYMASLDFGKSKVYRYDVVFDTTTDWTWIPAAPCGSNCDDFIDDAEDWDDYDWSLAGTPVSLGTKTLNYNTFVDLTC